VGQSKGGPAGLSMMEIRRFRSGDLDAVVGLCRAEGWDTYVADPERTCHALSAAGVITMVAVEDGNVCGFAQLLTDGAVRAYLANIVVAATSGALASADSSLRNFSVRLSRLTSTYCPPKVPRHFTMLCRTGDWPSIGYIIGLLSDTSGDSGLGHHELFLRTDQSSPPFRFS
jgi:hypothetical protein